MLTGDLGSGCVTSAEAVLVQQQGVEKLLEAIAAKKYVVVTLSLPSLASIAVYFDRSLQETHHKMRNYLKSVGVAMVCDAAVATDVAMIEAREEFLHRYIVFFILTYQKFRELIIFVSQISEPHRSGVDCSSSLRGRIVKPIVLSIRRGG